MVWMDFRLQLAQFFFPLHFLNLVVNVSNSRLSSTCNALRSEGSPGGGSILGFCSYLQFMLFESSDISVILLI